MSFEPLGSISVQQFHQFGTTFDLIGYGVAVTSMTLTHQPGVRLPVSEKLKAFSRRLDFYNLFFPIGGYDGNYVG